MLWYYWLWHSDSLVSSSDRGIEEKAIIRQQILTLLIIISYYVWGVLNAPSNDNNSLLSGDWNWSRKTNIETALYIPRRKNKIESKEGRKKWFPSRLIPRLSVCLNPYVWRAAFLCGNVRRGWGRRNVELEGTLRTRPGQSRRLGGYDAGRPSSLQPAHWDFQCNGSQEKQCRSSITQIAADVWSNSYHGARTESEWTAPVARSHYWTPKGRGWGYAARTFRAHAILTSLLTSLLQRYWETKPISGLDQIIEIGLEVPDHSDAADWQALWLEKLGEWYKDRFRHHRRIENLDHAINTYDKLVKSETTNSSNQISRLVMLGMALHERFMSTSRIPGIKISCRGTPRPENKRIKNIQAIPCWFLIGDD